MPKVIRTKTVRPARRTAPRKLRGTGVAPIPSHRDGTLPVTAFELEMEKLAGVNQHPDFGR